MIVYIIAFCFTISFWLGLSKIAGLKSFALSGPVPILQETIGTVFAHTGIVTFDLSESRLVDDNNAVKDFCTVKDVFNLSWERKPAMQTLTLPPRISFQVGVVVKVRNRIIGIYITYTHVHNGTYTCTHTRVLTSASMEVTGVMHALVVILQSALQLIKLRMSVVAWRTLQLIEIRMSVVAWLADVCKEHGGCD